MSLPEPLIILLRDEAYVDLAQGTVVAALDELQTQKEEVSSTRPPFGIIATKRTREAFTSSMQLVLNNEAALKSRLTKIEVLAKSIKAQLRASLHAYMESALPEYGVGAAVLGDFDGWERCLVVEYGEMMLGYARELRSTRTLVQSTPVFDADVYARRVKGFAELQLAAENLDGIATLLDVSAQRITNLCGPLYSEVQLPPPPFVQQAPWVERIVTLGDPEMMEALTARENTVRAHLANELATVRAEAAAARDKLRTISAGCLSDYWEQLRAHARQYYVKECDVDEALAQLEARYVTAEIRRHRESLNGSNDPYSFER